MLKTEIKNLSKEKSGTSTYTTSGKELKEICDEFDISNRYLLEDSSYYQAGVDLDQRGYKKLVII
jgi:hypothetical protein